MKAPAGGLISLFSHKVHSFFRKALRARNLSQRYTLNQTESYRCFNDLIDQDRFEHIEGSIPGGSYYVSKVACWPRLAISETAFLSKETKVSPPSQLPS